MMTTASDVQMMQASLWAFLGLSVGAISASAQFTLVLTNPLSAFGSCTQSAAGANFAVGDSVDVTSPTEF